MTQTEIWHYPSGEALVFRGIVLQAAAIVWIWRDWQMIQYHYGDWRKNHKKSEADTCAALEALWTKFGGAAEVPPPDFKTLSAAKLGDMTKEFPTSTDDQILTERKIVLLTRRYGVGPSDADLRSIREKLDLLSLIRRGIANYRTFIRRQTFNTALKMMAAGFALQLLGAWPSNWVVEVEKPLQKHEALRK